MVRSGKTRKDQNRKRQGRVVKTSQGRVYRRKLLKQQPEPEAGSTAAEAVKSGSITVTGRSGKGEADPILLHGNEDDVTSDLSFKWPAYLGGSASSFWKERLEGMRVVGLLRMMCRSVLGAALIPSNRGRRSLTVLSSSSRLDVWGGQGFLSFTWPPLLHFEI